MCCRCTCDSNRNARVFREEDYVMRFLMGLNEDFAMVKSQILLMNPFPDLNSTFSNVIQYERQNGLAANSQEEEVMINVVDGKRFKKFVGKGKYSGSTKVCTFCGKDGHTIDTCYRKHGFPPNFKFRNSSSSTNSMNSQEYESKVKDTKSVNGNFFFTPWEYKALKSLLQNSAGKSIGDAQEGCTVN